MLSLCESVPAISAFDPSVSSTSRNRGGSRRVLGSNRATTWIWRARSERFGSAEGIQDAADGRRQVRAARRCGPDRFVHDVEDFHALLQAPEIADACVFGSDGSIWTYLGARSVFRPRYRIVQAQRLRRHRDSGHPGRCAVGRRRAADPVRPLVGEPAVARARCSEKHSVRQTTPGRAPRCRRGAVPHQAAVPMWN